MPEIGTTLARDRPTSIEAIGPASQPRTMSARLAGTRPPAYKPPPTWCPALGYKQNHNPVPAAWIIPRLDRKGGVLNTLCRSVQRARLHPGSARVIGARTLLRACFLAAVGTLAAPHAQANRLLVSSALPN